MDSREDSLSRVTTTLVASNHENLGFAIRSRGLMAKETALEIGFNRFKCAEFQGKK